jgi:uncharacterized protein YbbC (DUF1343 family)
MPKVQTGLEHFIANPPKWAAQKRLGLLCNPASVDSRLSHARSVFVERFSGRLKALYSPQHGFFAEKQDNMVESDNIIDPLTGLPVYSLYGQTRIPSEEMLTPIDILVVDLQDVGTRVYTYIYTVSYCLEVAAACGKKVVILDRPNPVNGELVEGNCLKSEWASFVGRFPIPMRHGLTIGELAMLLNSNHNIDCNLEVIPMKGWKRSMYFAETQLPWVAPSPNLPTPDSAIVYPGQVIWEGTNVSEGRGTTQPFELFGAPFFNPNRIAAALTAELSGVVLRPTVFEPTSNKWQQTACNGFQIHVTDLARFRPYFTTLCLLQSVLMSHQEDFRWKSPPYEYELEKKPIDLIIGDRSVRKRIETSEPVESIAASWQDELDEFKELSRGFYLYD